MSEFVQIEIQLSRSSAVTCAPTGRSTAVFWLQGITLIWMLVECGLSLYAAAAARSPHWSHSAPIASWSYCPREWFFCSFYLTFRFPNGTPLVLPALYCSLLLLSSA